MKFFLYPDIGRIDEPLQLHMDGLIPFEPVTISMWMEHEGKNILQSSLRLQADEMGKLLISSFSKGKENGFSTLMWKLQPLPASLNHLQNFILHIDVEARESGRKEKRTVTRLFKEDYVAEVLLSNKTVEGTFYYPKNATKLPTLILLGPINESPLSRIAALLASHGYGVLALNYTKRKGHQSGFVNIPIETVDHAVNWLMNHPSTNHNQLVVLGIEKGAELALLTASKNPNIRGVIAISPASHVFQAITNHKRSSSWSENEQAVPYVPFSNSFSTYIKKWQATLTKNPLKIPNKYETSLKKYMKKGKREAQIAVENINGPILLLSAEEDQHWPANYMGEIIVEHLKDHSFLHPVNHKIFSNSEQLLIPPYLPSDSLENALAGEKTWQEIIHFLNIHFPPAKIETETIPLSFV